MDAQTSEDALACRTATLADLPSLVTLEQASFETDGISRRQFRHLLTKGNAVILVAVENGELVADLVLLFNEATRVARIYSIAVAPRARGRGIARRLVLAAEALAAARGRDRLRLEVRKDNRASIGLFESLGYRRFGEYRDYYQDHADAWRYQKCCGGVSACASPQAT